MGGRGHCNGVTIGGDISFCDTHHATKFKEIEKDRGVGDKCEVISLVSDSFLLV